MKLVILWSDGLIFLLVASLIAFFWHIRQSPLVRERWFKVFGSRLGMITFVILATYIIIALLDSVHFRRALPQEPGQAVSTVYYDNRVESALDVLVGGMSSNHEHTYSAPLALKSFAKINMKDEQGRNYRDFPPLQHALLIGPQWLVLRHSVLPWKSAWVTQGVIVVFATWFVHVGNLYHLLGTDLAGNDVLYKSLKGIRTGVLLGSLATLVMLPIAVSRGIAAGYFKGWVDDLVQYLYTTLSSIPGILLIAASVLLFQVYIDLNPGLFEVGLEKADAKFVALCFILGVTSWATLCRLMRAETLKISQLEYVQAAHAFGVSHTRIIVRHILPNVVHIILITFVLEFSALVLAEAVLSYIGVGVDPSMASWGNMINGARAELSREPAIWWTLSGAFFFMFTLVLSANLFSDLVRDAFDPRVSDGAGQ